MPFNYHGLAPKNAGNNNIVNAIEMKLKSRYPYTEPRSPKRKYPNALDNKIINPCIINAHTTELYII